jgi:hypothetical protein
MDSDNNDINIYVVTYNCNNIKLTGDNPSIEDFVNNFINPGIKKFVHTGNSETIETAKSNENNIFIFGIQEAPENSNEPYYKMLNTIKKKLNNNNNYIYNYYYFNKLNISNTKLFIIYNDNNIKVDNDNYFNLSGNFKNRFNKHTLRVTIKHNNKSIVTVITTHLRKGNLAPFFINDLKKILTQDKKDVYKDNIILFGDLNSRTLYREKYNGNYISYNDVKLSKNNIIATRLKLLQNIPLKVLLKNHDYYKNTLVHKNYYDVTLSNNAQIRFNNATSTLQYPTYRYNKTVTANTQPPALNFRKKTKKRKLNFRNKTKKNILSKLKSVFSRGKGDASTVSENNRAAVLSGKNEGEDKDEGKFKVPSYPDRVLYKTKYGNNELNFKYAHVLNFSGSDHLPVIAKFTITNVSYTANPIFIIR